MKNIFERFSPWFFAALLLVCATFAHSQVPVAIAPPLHPKFSDNSGNVLSGGFLYSYDAGTTNLRPTYLDLTGTIQNPDPIPLDATGAPSNGSTQTGIWLANQAYKFCAYNAALVQQWCVDNVTGYLGLLNTVNAWTFQQTFSLPIVDLSIDNQIVLGAPGNQTTLDFPPPSANVTLHFPNTGDTMVGQATTDTLLHKTLTSPAITTPTVNACPVAYGNSTCVVAQNNGVTGTTLNTLTKVINTGGVYAVQVSASSDTGGAYGITTGGAGITGNATITTSGVALCVFDGATVGGDYIQISSLTAGNCHDAGATYPSTGGQVVGRVLSTQSIAGTYLMYLFGPEMQPITVVPGLRAISGVAAGSGAGTSPTVSCAAGVTCHDNEGFLTVTTGTSPATSAVIATVTFSGLRVSPACTISPANANAAALSGATQVYPVVTLPSFTLNSGSSALTGATIYWWYYTCNYIG
jgi:hypothetical protein